MGLRLRRRKRTKAQISFNMSRVRSTGSEIEQVMEAALRRAKLRPTKHPKILGRPDFVFQRAMIAVFCDSHFWHGYNWKVKQKEIHRNRSFWVPKILSNMRRDRLVNRRLQEEGWKVLRFWEHEILRFPGRCTARVKKAIAAGRSET
jgi:DNA mismatch endonuclease Vsr